MDFTPFFIYVLPVITVITVGLLGSTRRIGFWLALILAIVLTPVGGFLAALILGPKKRKLPKRSDKKS
jgi:Sec-independent protein secretion pathway component TatC